MTDDSAMNRILERAVLYDITRFAKQFIIEQDLDTPGVQERGQTVLIDLRDPATDTLHWVLFEASAREDGDVRVRAYEGSGYLPEPGEDTGAHSVETTVGFSETGDPEGLLGWLRLAVAGWLQATKGSG